MPECEAEKKFRSFERSLNKNKYAKPCRSAGGPITAHISRRNYSRDVLEKMGLIKENEHRGERRLCRGEA